MPTREEMFGRFGPLLLEALLKVLLDETNRLRQQTGMPQVTMQDLIDQLNNRLNETTPYNWMDIP